MELTFYFLDLCEDVKWLLCFQEYIYCIFHKQHKTKRDMTNENNKK